MSKVVVLGLSGMDWVQFREATSRGQLPNLAALAGRGWSQALSGAPVIDGPAAWASLASGVQPEVHRVWRAQEGWAGGLRPTSRASWRAAPIWARLEAAGVSTGSVGWPASRPGAAWAGVHVDDEMAEPSGATAGAWALPPYCAPVHLREAIRDLRMHPTQVARDALQDLGLRGPFPARDRLTPALALAMAEAASLHAVGVWMLSRETPELLMLHQPWLGRVFAAADLLNDDRGETVIPGALRFVDALAGRLIGSAPADTLTLVVSPGRRGRPGVMIAAGPGVRPGAAPAGVSVLDLVPTLLARFGLKDEALPGRVISELGARPAFRLAPVVAPAAPEPPDEALLADAAGQGYPRHPPPPASWTSTGLAELAAAILWRDWAAAGMLAREALAIDPGCLLAVRVLSTTLVLQEEPQELPRLALALKAAAPARGWGALALGAAKVIDGDVAGAMPDLLEAETDPDISTLLPLAVIWVAADRPLAAERVYKAILASDPSNVAARVGLAAMAIRRRDFMTAETLLGEALRLDPGDPAVYVQWSRLCAATARRAQSRRMAELAVRFGAPRDFDQKLTTI